MKQEQIKYIDIKKLGFLEFPCSDNVYENMYGFQYVIIEKKLTKHIYLEWAKETRLCKMVRLSNSKNGDIANEMPIKNIEHLKEVINFFCSNKTKQNDNIIS